MTKKKMSADDILSAAQAGEILGKSPRQMRHLAQHGRVPARRVGRDWVFRRGDVTAMVGLLPGPGRPPSAPC